MFSEGYYGPLGKIPCPSNWPRREAHSSRRPLPTSGLWVPGAAALGLSAVAEMRPPHRGLPGPLLGTWGAAALRPYLAPPTHTVTRPPAHLPHAWLLRAALHEPVPMVTLSVPRGPTWLSAARLQ